MLKRSFLVGFFIVALIVLCWFNCGDLLVVSKNVLQWADFKYGALFTAPSEGIWA
jgi:hypothetical protein